MKKRTLLGLLAALPLSLLTACGSSDGGGSTSARLINASPGYSSLDLYVEDSLKVSAVGFGTASSFHDVDSGDVTTALTIAGSATELLTQTRTFSGSDKYSVVAYGWDGALKSVAITEDEDEPDSGKTLYSVLNTSTDAGSLDVYLTAEDDDLASSTAVRAAVDGGTRSAFSTVTSGTYRLRVTAAGDTDDVRLDVSNVVLPSKGVMTLILAPTSGGLLVNGMTLQQGGDLTKQFTTKARMRVVAAVAGGAKVSASAATTSGSTTLSSNLPSPGIQNPYVLVDAGSVTVNSSANLSGSVTTLSPLTLTLAAGSDTTLLVTGASAATATATALADDNRLPTTTTKYKIRMVHVSNTLAAGSLNLTVTLSPVISNLVYGAGSAYVSRTSSTAADVEVTSVSDGSTIYSKTGSDALPLTAKSVYTMFVLDKLDGTPQGLLLQER